LSFHEHVCGPQALSVLHTISIACDAGMLLISMKLWNAAFFTFPMWPAFSNTIDTSLGTQLWTSAVWDLDLGEVEEVEGMVSKQRVARLTEGVARKVEVRYDGSLWGGGEEFLWLGPKPLTEAHSSMLRSLQRVLQGCRALSICDPDAAGVRKSLIDSL